MRISHVQMTAVIIGLAMVQRRSDVPDIMITVALFRISALIRNVNPMIIRGNEIRKRGMLVMRKLVNPRDQALNHS